MAKIVFLPHPDICPDGVVIETNSGETICSAALRNGIEIEHACEMAAACTTCHVYVREGFEHLEPADDLEEDLLDKGMGCRSRFTPQLSGSAG